MVEDPDTGDRKFQEEERDGENTKGRYSLVQPDGTTLIVDYVVSGDSGFIANVRRSDEFKPDVVKKT